jgi:hypothetical protein
MTIERSAGLWTGHGAYFCGDGGRGATDELDALVARGAEMLGALFGRDVEIRFNSDRRSGGGWLKNSLKGFAGSCQVGLNGALVKTGWPELIESIGYDAACRRYDGLPDELHIRTYVKASALRDPTLADSDGMGERYSSVAHDSLDAAVEWLRANIDPVKIID